MIIETAGSVPKERYGNLLNSSFVVDKKRNVLWGPEYVVWFFRELDEGMIEGLIAEMITLKELENG